MRKILTILLLAFSLSAWGTKYYVDPTGVNDAGRNGTIGQEWATPAYACTRVSSPDTVFINAGTYNQGSTQIVKPLGVSIVGAGQGIAIVNTTYTNASSVQAALQCASTVGTTVDDNCSISHFTFTGTNYTSGRAIYIGYRNNINIHHLTVEGFNYTGIYANGSDGSTYPDLFLTGIVIQNCTLNDNGSYIGADGYVGSIRLRGTDGTEVSYNTIKNDGREECNSHCISTYRNRRMKIHDNTLYRRDQEVTLDGTEYWNFFLEEWNYKGGSEYYNNTHYGLAKFSLGGDENDITDGTEWGYKVYGNKWYNESPGLRTFRGETDTKYCICIEGNNHKDVIISRNYIQNFAWGLEISSPSSYPGGFWEQSWIIDGVTFEYNVIDGVGFSDFSYGYGIIILAEMCTYPYYAHYKNIKILNNTINGENGGSFDGFNGIRCLIEDTLSTLVVRNNIITGFTDQAISIYAQGDSTLLLTGLDITHNNLYNNVINSTYIEASITHPSSDITTGNITSDPLFVSATNFALQSGSPCIGAGIDVGLLSDYLGNSIVGLPDIGAYENQSVGDRALLIGTKLVIINGKATILSN